MRKDILTLIKYGTLLLLIIVCFLIFFPRKYEVIPFRERPNTQYWSLSTNSKIGYFFVSGIGEKKPNPIIYLHGGPGGQVSDNHIESLKPLSNEGFDIYFYDQIGSGHSDRLNNIEDYSVKRHVRDLEEIVKNIGSEKVILIAQSWGALLAVQYFTNNQNKVKKMIFTGPGPILPIQNELANISPPDSLNLKSPLFSNKQGNKKAHNWRTRIALNWAYISGKKLMRDSEADDFFAYLNNELNKSTLCDVSLYKKSNVGGGFYSHIMTLKSFYFVENQRDMILGAKIPLLILKGQCDNQKWGFTQEYLGIFPNHSLEIIPDAGHAIWEEKPNLYLTKIREFLLEKDTIID